MKTLKEDREAIVETLHKARLDRFDDYTTIGEDRYLREFIDEVVVPALLSHEERVVAMVKKEIKSWLMNYDSKDGYSTAYDGVIEHIYDRVNTLTLPITDENV